MLSGLPSGDRAAQKVPLPPVQKNGQGTTAGGFDQSAAPGVGTSRRRRLDDIRSGRRRAGARVVAQAAAGGRGQIAREGVQRRRDAAGPVEFHQVAGEHDRDLIAPALDPGEVVRD